MKVSIVTIAKTKEEIEELKKALTNQTYKDYEFVYSTKKGIPQAWNDAFKKVKGKYILTIDSEARPMTNTWIEEMVDSIEKHRGSIIKGIEVSSNSWTWCNIISNADIFKNNKVNENYPIAEDTEIFARLDNCGYKRITLPIAPVRHDRNDPKKNLQRAYRYGRLNTRIKLRYKNSSFKEANKVEGTDVFKREIYSIVSSGLYLIGIIVELIKYKNKEIFMKKIIRKAKSSLKLCIYEEGNVHDE
ncbi:MAG: glycosyltransferase [Candidatus Aenigmatarchaeota archaeon]